MSDTLLIRYRGNWADEMDVTGFIVIDADKWNGLVSRVEGFFARRGNWEWGIGTNEQIEFGSFLSWRQELTQVIIRDSDVDALVALFSRVGVHADSQNGMMLREGLFPIPDEFEWEDSEDILTGLNHINALQKLRALLESK